MHSGTEHGRPGIVDVVPGDVVVSGHAHSWVIVLVLKSCVVINKLDKAISETSCISKNDNYLKWREISILYLPPPRESSCPKETGKACPHWLPPT